MSLGDVIEADFFNQYVKTGEQEELHNLVTDY